MRAGDRRAASDAPRRSRPSVPGRGPLPPAAAMSVSSSAPAARKSCCCSCRPRLAGLGPRRASQPGCSRNTCSSTPRRAFGSQEGQPAGLLPENPQQHSQAGIRVPGGPAAWPCTRKPCSTDAQGWPGLPSPHLLHQMVMERQALQALQQRGAEGSLGVAGRQVQHLCPLVPGPAKVEVADVEGQEVDEAVAQLQGSHTGGGGGDVEGCSSCSAVEQQATSCQLLSEQRLMWRAPKSMDWMRL